MSQSNSDDELALDAAAKSPLNRAPKANEQMTPRSQGNRRSTNNSRRKKTSKVSKRLRKDDIVDEQSDCDNPLDLSPDSPLPDQEASSCTSPNDTSRTRRIRRNYKNMSRQRRIEANARERTRVHLISAAFDSLRQAVPAYAHNQRLSKLAVLRVACSYIMALTRLAEDDSSYVMALTRLAEDDSRQERRPTFAECVDICTQTIQMEGKPVRGNGRNKADFH